MQFNFTSWSSIEDLISKIKSAAHSISEEAPLEIERKWIVDYSIIEFLKTAPGVKKIRHLTNLQAYLSIDPEVRYRSALDVDSGKSYNYVSYKTNGDLSREEYELEISMPSAIKFAKVIREDKSVREYRKSKFITKDYYVFEYDDFEFEISMVDNDRNFTYMEIEFKDIESANNYKIPELIDRFVMKEVTNDASYKMKNYWKRTRLKK